jgi:metal-responsive CopG/Arc/MetJ family transcriptional regulator
VADKPQIHVNVDDEMLARLDRIAEKYGIGNRSDVVRQAISRWYYDEVEVSHRTNGNGRKKER